jgi:hypothetical protein
MKTTQTMHYSLAALLGSVLLEQKKFAEAESLSASGSDDLKQRAATIPTDMKPRLRETFQRVAQL